MERSFRHPPPPPLVEEPPLVEPPLVEPPLVEPPLVPVDPLVELLLLLELALEPLPPSVLLAGAHVPFAHTRYRTSSAMKLQSASIEHGKAQ